MFQLQQCIRFLLLLSCIIVSLQVYGGSLDCNLNWTTCCWRNAGDGAPWQIYRSKIDNFKNETILQSSSSSLSSFDENKSDQYFLATSVTPKVKYSSDWTSCVTCSRTGLVTILIKAYQLSNTRIKLCWKYVNDKNSIYRYCTFLRNWNFNDYFSKKFTITPGQPIQFYIKFHNHGKTTAVAIIHSIKVIIDQCYQPLSLLSQSKQRSMKLVGMERSKDNEMLRIRPITTRYKIRKTSIVETSTIQSNLNSSFLLRDIFGDAFAKFLEDDSDGLIIDNDKQFDKDNANKEKQVYEKNDNNNHDNERFILPTTTTTRTTTTTTISTTTKMFTPKLPFVLNLLECNTIGGCLFDHSICSYQHSQLSRGSTFQPVRLQDRNFMQAFTKPNTVAVLETDTSFTEEYKIVFDILEYTEGERFYGCCYNTKLESEVLINVRKMLGGKRPSELFCPFATEAHSTPIVWRTERFTCPPATKKILFVCENNGQINGTCAMDNIRIHKIFDILEIEPCQKNILAIS